LLTTQRRLLRAWFSPFEVTSLRRHPRRLSALLSAEPVIFSHRHNFIPRFAEKPWEASS
jgi:hypothetical protein